jgi:hypothetical protein
MRETEGVDDGNVSRAESRGHSEATNGRYESGLDAQTSGSRQKSGAHA